MSEPSVLYHVAQGVATLTLNRPHVLNALDLSLSAQLAEAAEAAAADAAVWVVVVRGAGRAFSSGMDRKALASGAIDEAFYRHWIRALNTLEDMGKLSVAEFFVSDRQIPSPPGVARISVRQGLAEGYAIAERLQRRRVIAPGKLNLP